MKILNPLHEVITDLEGEGHALAGRLHDVADRLKADIDHLIHGKKSEVDTFVKSLVDSLIPELDRVKVEAVAKAVDEVHKLGDELKTKLDEIHKAVSGSTDTTKPTAPATAPAPVEPAPATAPTAAAPAAAPAQG